MDPIFDRLGRLIRSNNPFHSSRSPEEEELKSILEDLDAELSAPKGAPPRRPSSQGSRTYQEQRRQESARPSPPPQPALDPTLVQAYAVLGLRPDATWDQINAAHRALLKKHHPDRHAGNEALIKQATAQSQKINEAFQVLKKYLGR